MAYKIVFPTQDEVVYANGDIPYIPEESLDPTKALFRVDFNSFKTYTDSNFSQSMLSLGLTEFPRFIVTESHLEGPYDIAPNIDDSWKTIGRKYSVLTHLAPLDMVEYDYVPIFRNHIDLNSDGKSWLGFEPKGSKFIRYVSEGINELLRIDLDKVFENDDGSLSYDFCNERNETLGVLTKNFKKNFMQIELDITGIESSTGSDVVKQYFQLISGYNKNKLPSDITLRGKFSKGFAFRPNLKGKYLDDFLQSPDVLLNS